MTELDDPLGVHDDSASDFESTLDAARRGDGPAFETLYRSLNRRVVSFARARRAPDPEGLVNDVFVRVFSNLSDFEGNEEQFNGWVFRIARNVLIDGARQRARRVEEVLGSDHGEIPIEQPGPEDIAAAQIHGEELLRHLEVLTPDQRDVILLRVVADQSLEAVAASLDKSVGSIKSMQRRALRTLAREISRQAVSQ